MLKIFDTFVNIFSYDELNIKILESVKKRKKATFFYLNTFSLYLIFKSQNYATAFNQADYITPDGTSIVYAARLLNNIKIKKLRFNLNFFLYLENIIIKNNLTIYLLGSHKNILDKAVHKLKERGIKVVGYNDGYNLNNSLIDNINQLQPDIIFIGMGMPKQELWVIENSKKINTGAFITVGNLFDIISGNFKIAPKWLTNTPFEWVYRIFQEPKKLIPRYIKCNSFYLYLLVKYYFNKRVK